MLAFLMERITKQTRERPFVLLQHAILIATHAKTVLLQLISSVSFRTRAGFLRQSSCVVDRQQLGVAYSHLRKANLRCPPRKSRFQARCFSLAWSVVSFVTESRWYAPKGSHRLLYVSLAMGKLECSQAEQRTIRVWRTTMGVCSSQLKARAQQQV